LPWAIFSGKGGTKNGFDEREEPANAQGQILRQKKKRREEGQRQCPFLLAAT
jgi:hypothetical protein